MNNTMLKEMLTRAFDGKLRKDAVVNFFTNENKVTALIKVPRRAERMAVINGVPSTFATTECSTANLSVWGIEKEENIKKKVDDFLRFYDFLRA